MVVDRRPLVAEIIEGMIVESVSASFCNTRPRDQEREHHEVRAEKKGK
jgi:hypothetical protein